MTSSFVLSYPKSPSPSVLLPQLPCYHSALHLHCQPSVSEFNLALKIYGRAAR